MTALDRLIIVQFPVRGGLIGVFYWRGLQHFPAVLGMLVAIAAAIYFLYPSQVRSIGGAWRWVLPGLRAGALGALAISMLQPVMSRVKNSTERGAIVFLVDTSRSMSVADVGRPWGEWVAIASALGRISPDLRDAHAAALQADTDRLVARSDAAERARRDWDYAKLAGRGEAAARARLDQIVLQLQQTARSVMEQVSGRSDADVLRGVTAQLAADLTDDTQMKWLDVVQQRARLAATEAERLRLAADEELFKNNPEVRDTCIELSSQSRLQLALEAVRGAHGLVSQLGGAAPVLVFGFGDRISPFSAQPEGVTPSPQPVVAEGSVSNLTGAVQTLLDQLTGTAVRAVVVLTDGRQVGGDAMVPSGLSVSGVPVYGVRVSSLNGVRDVSVLHMSAPSSAFIGETIHVRADIRATGMEKGRAEILFTAGDVTQTQFIDLADGKLVSVEFSAKATAMGPQKVAIDVAPLPGEATVENNHAERWVKVLNQKIRVAAYAGAAGWDYQYVRNALARAPWAELKDGILAQRADSTAKKDPGSGGQVLNASSATQARGNSFPLTPDEILRQDVVLLFDVGISSLDAEQWAAMRRLVTDLGGSVILIAGDAHVPGEYLGNPVTAALLPFTSPAPVWQTWPGERPAVHLTPATLVEKIDAMQLGDEMETNEHRWEQLPAFFRFLPVAKLKSNSRALLVESDSGAAVLTESRVGAGRTLFFGANETWRWRYKVGERDQDRFWLQLIRYAAEEPYEAQSHGQGLASVSLDADAIETPPGDVVHVRARVLGADGLPTKKASYSLQVVQDGSVVRKYRMTPGTGAGRFSAAVADLDEGKYMLRVDGEESVRAERRSQ